MAGEVRILALFGGMARLGSERANLEALTALRQGGAEVRLVVSDAPWAEEVRRDVLARGFAITQAPYLLLPRKERRFNPLIAYPITIARASAILIREILRFRPTHIYASSQMFVLNFLPALAIMPTPLVYRCGDQPILHSRLFRALWRFIAWRARRFVAVSRFIADRLAESGVARARISVIYARPPTRLVTSAPSRTSPGFTFGFVGQINETKGPHLLVEAFSDLARTHADARLVIAGRISDWAGDEWARALRDRVSADDDLSGKVSFPGFVEDVSALLGGCQVAVTPTVTEEPLANVVMEAKAAGVPSIVFPSGGLPEIVEHGVDGYICARRDAEALREAMTYYLERRDAVAGQGVAARASLRRLGVDRFVEKWTAVVGPAGDGVAA